jgi:hypothetical protein
VRKHGSVWNPPALAVGRFNSRHRPCGLYITYITGVLRSKVDPDCRAEELLGAFSKCVSEQSKMRSLMISLIENSIDRKKETDKP